MATICTAVLTLPAHDTVTADEAPTPAIHSRSAETAISRPMMISAGSATQLWGSAITISTSAVATISLSATGSRKAPSADP